MLSRRNQFLFLSSILITNIGNGAHLLTVGYYLYQKTQNVLAFGFVLALEYFIAFVMQFVSGSLVDRHSPQKVMVVLDAICGTTLLLTALLLWQDGPVVLLLLTVVLLSACQPLYRSALYAFRGQLGSADELVTLVARSTSALQAGQLLGMACAGVMLTYVSAPAVFLTNALSFLMSGLLVHLVRGVHFQIKSDHLRFQVSTILKDWQEMLAMLRQHPSFWAHLVLTCGDFLTLSLINLMLVPINKTIGNHPINLTWLDGGFAVGALVTSALLSKTWIDKVGVKRIGFLGLSTQAGVFLGLSFTQPLWGLVLLMVVMGMANALSITTITSSLQLRSAGPIQGRVSALRQMCLSVFGLILLPALGLLVAHQGVQVGLWACALVLLGFALHLIRMCSQQGYGPGVLNRKVPISTE